MAIDPLFWDMAGQPQLRNESLSFRYFGALTCPGLIIGEVGISEEGGPSEIAARMLRIAEDTLEEIATTWTLDKFLDGINASVNPKRLFSTAICTLIADGRKEYALELCQSSASRGEVRGFLTSRGTFPEMAAGHLDGGRASRWRKLSQAFWAVGDGSLPRLPEPPRPSDSLG